MPAFCPRAKSKWKFGKDLAGFHVKYPSFQEYQLHLPGLEPENVSRLCPSPL